MDIALYSTAATSLVMIAAAALSAGSRAMGLPMPVMVATAAVGLSAWLGSGLSLVACLLLGAAVSTTDPAAVISTFREIGAPRRLLALLEGESLLNDAAAIALYTLLLGVAAATATATPGGLATEFARVFSVGAATGLALAWLANRLYPLLDGSAAAEASAHRGAVLRRLHRGGVRAGWFGGGVCGCCRGSHRLVGVCQHGAAQLDGDAGGLEPDRLLGQCRHIVHHGLRDAHLAAGFRLATDRIAGAGLCRRLAAREPDIEQRIRTAGEAQLGAGFATQAP
jgi:hypothetical protein